MNGKIANRLVFQSRFIWPFVGWCLFAAPLLVCLAAHLVPNMLTGLVLLRTENSNSEYVWDCFCLTTMSLFVAAFGLAIVRIFDLYGKLQFGYELHPHSIHNPSEQRSLDTWWWTNHSTSWPTFWVVGWLVVSIAYPIRSFLVTQYWVLKVPPTSEIGKTLHLDWRLGLLGLLGGCCFACLVLLTVSIAHLFLTRRVPSACGLLPFEDIAAWLLDRLLGPVQSESVRGLSSDSSMKRVAQSKVHRWSRYFFGPGFVSDTSLWFLPGHVQLAVIMGFAAVGYYWLFDSSYSSSGWSSSTFHVGLYALLLFLLGGGLLALVCFIVGRLSFHVASLLLGVAVLALSFWVMINFGNYFLVDSNRYFAIASPTSVDSTSRAPNTSEISDDSGTFTILAKQKRNAESAGTEPQQATKRLPLIDIYRNWNFPRGRDNKRTMVVITASGGGIQSSAWTAKVLANLDAHFPTFSESIGLVSGVSGGSVGSMYYLGHRGLRKNPESELGTGSPENRNPAPVMRLSAMQRMRIEQIASVSSLEAIGWGLAFPDLVKHIPLLNRRISQEDDRGLALESQWWNRMGDSNSDAELMRNLRMRDLVDATNHGLVPPVIFNATMVETGQRVMIASFESNREAALNADSVEAIDYERYMSPIDFFGFYEPLFTDPYAVNPRVSTAVRLSASFAYATPVARPILPPDRINPEATESLLRRANYHLCDGGYSDNTGMVAAVTVITDLIDQYSVHYSKTNEPPPFDRILFVSIESFPDNQVEVDNDATGLLSGLFGPLSAIFAARVASQSERAELELDLLIRADDKSFSRLSDAETMAVFDVDRFDGYQSTANQVMTLMAESQKLNEGQKEEMRGLLEPITKIELRARNSSSGQKEIPVSQVNSVKKKVANLLESKASFEEAMSLAFAPADLTIAEDFLRQSQDISEMELLIGTERVATASSPFKLSIAGIQMRFSPTEDPQNTDTSTQGEDTTKLKTTDGAGKRTRVAEKQDKKIPNPPLSWMLSPYDKYRIERAWQNQMARLRDTTPRQAGPTSTGSMASGQALGSERLRDFLQFEEQVEK